MRRNCRQHDAGFRWSLVSRVRDFVYMSLSFGTAEIFVCSHYAILLKCQTHSSTPCVLFSIPMTTCKFPSFKANIFKYSTSLRWCEADTRSIDHTPPLLPDVMQSSNSRRNSLVDPRSFKNRIMRVDICERIQQHKDDVPEELLEDSTMHWLWSVYQEERRLSSEKEDVETQSGLIAYSWHGTDSWILFRTTRSYPTTGFGSIDTDLVNISWTERHRLCPTRHQICQVHIRHLRTACTLPSIHSNETSLRHPETAHFQTSLFVFPISRTPRGPER